MLVEIIVEPNKVSTIETAGLFHFQAADVAKLIISSIGDVGLY